MNDDSKPPGVPLWKAMMFTYEDEVSKGSTPEQAFRFIADQMPPFAEEIGAHPCLISREGKKNICKEMTFEVGARADVRVKLSFVDELKNPDGHCRGACELVSEDINIYLLRDYPRVDQLRTFIHEFMHVAEMVELGGLTFSERAIGALSTVLSQALIQSELVDITPDDYIEFDAYCERINEYNELNHKTACDFRDKVNSIEEE